MLNYSLKSTDLNKDSLVWDLSNYNINELHINCNNMNELECYIDHLDIINRLIELLDFYAFCNKYPDCIAEDISSEHVFDFFLNLINLKNIY
jgi:hypothetical protein